jgi:hypothetical protein
MQPTLLTTIVVLTAAVAGCGTSGDEAGPDPATPTAPADSSGTSTPTTTQPGPTTPSPVPAEAVEGTIVRFASPEVQIDVTITQDNLTTRDLLSLLPLTIAFEEFSGREKISYLTRELGTEGSPGHDPEDGDLIYFAPWGNLGFYYNTEGIGHDDRVIHLGTYDATRDELARLEARDVTITVVR